MADPIFQDNFAALPEINSQHTILRSGTLGTHHPITQTLLLQLSQDMLRVTDRSGTATDLTLFDRRFRPFRPWIQESLYRALQSGEAHYLVLDFGDDISEWSDPPTDTVPEPYEIYPIIPTIEYLMGGYQYAGGVPINEARYIKVPNPYPFALGRVLDAELATHDRITQGIADTVVAPGTLLFGIQGLWQKLLTGGQAITNLTTRLLQTKRAMVNGGVLAYSLQEEQPGLLPKPYAKEHESLGVIENRICAITGIPSFIIWGHTDGDGFGVSTSLSLYAQRLGSMAARYLVPALDLLAQLLLPGDSDTPWFDIVDLYPEDRATKTSRFEGAVSGLVALVSVGAMTAIEVRDTVASQFELVLDPNPQVTTANPENPTI
jgi:hypothetical protein